LRSAFLIFLNKSNTRNYTLSKTIQNKAKDPDTMHLAKQYKRNPIDHLSVQQQPFSHSSSEHSKGIPKFSQSMALAAVFLNIHLSSHNPCTNLPTNNLQNLLLKFHTIAKFDIIMKLPNVIHSCTQSQFTNNVMQLFILTSLHAFHNLIPTKTNGANTAFKHHFSP